MVYFILKIKQHVVKSATISDTVSQSRTASIVYAVKASLNFPFILQEKKTFPVYTNQKNKSICFSAFDIAPFKPEVFYKLCLGCPHNPRDIPALVPKGRRTGQEPTDLHFHAMYELK